MEFNESTIGEEGKGKPPYKVHFPKKDSKPCLWSLVLKNCGASLVFEKYVISTCVYAVL